MAVIRLEAFNIPAPDDYEPLVSDGFWILHEPLSEGEHEITFGGTLCDPGTGEPFNVIEATYLLTVVDDDDDDDNDDDDDSDDANGGDSGKANPFGIQ